MWQQDWNITGYLRIFFPPQNHLNTWYSWEMTWTRERTAGQVMKRNWKRRNFNDTEGGSWTTWRLKEPSFFCISYAAGAEMLRYKEEFFFLNHIEGFMMYNTKKSRKGKQECRNVTHINKEKQLGQIASTVGLCTFLSGIHGRMDNSGWKPSDIHTWG